MRILSVLIILLNIGSVRAENRPHGIMVSHDNKCSPFWGGTDQVFYIPPDGWKKYYPIKTKKGTQMIKLSNKVCFFNKGNVEDCCNELELKYEKTDAIKKCTKGTSWFVCTFSSFLNF